jgi:dienelactone hydrolase
MNNLNIFFLASFVSFSAVFSVACQSQSVSIPTVKTNSNVQTNTEDKIPAPQTIKFDSADKLEIIGTFYESPKANSPAVLLLHQWQSTRKSYDEFAKRLQAKGFGVLAIDGRGFGESVKTTDGKTVSPLRTDDAVKAMKKDIDTAFNFLSNRKNVDAARVAIVGASYASSLAMIYGAENKAVKCVALLSPGINYFGNLPIENALKNYGDRPLLSVAAADDKESADTVKKLKSLVANDKYETQLYAHGGHGTGIFAAKVGLEDLLEQFLTKSLL